MLHITPTYSSDCERGEEEGGRARDDLEVLLLGEVHQARQLRDVAARVLDPEDVGVAGEPHRAGQGQLQRGVGGHAVQHHRHRARVRHGRVVSLQRRRRHAALVVARRHHHGRVAPGLRHGLGHLDGLQRGLAARAGQQQLVRAAELPHGAHHVELLLPVQVAELAVAAVHEVAGQGLPAQPRQVGLQLRPGYGLVLLERRHYRWKHSAEINLGGG